MTLYMKLADIAETADERALLAIRWPVGRMITRRPGPRKLRVAKYVVAEVYKVAIDDLDGSRGEAELCLARHVAWWIANSLGVNKSQIGRFSNRDHTTVINGIKRVRDLRADPAFKDHTDALLARVR